MSFFKYATVLPLGLATVLILQTSYGFGLPPDAGAPPIEIEVHQRDREVTFKFFAQDTILLFIRHRVQIGVSALSVNAASGEPIWSIGFSDPAAVAREVKYGVVPKGFRQDVPKSGKSPVLKNNAEYQVSARWGVVDGRATFLYQGK